MLSMVETLSSFLNWLEMVMVDKNIQQSDIAATGHVTDSAVSLLFSQKTKSVSTEMCQAISKATGISLITVYRRAGYLPAIGDVEIDMEQLADEISKMQKRDREEVVAFARLINNLRKNNNGL